MLLRATNAVFIPRFCRAKVLQFWILLGQTQAAKNDLDPRLPERLCTSLDSRRQVNAIEVGVFPKSIPGPSHDEHAGYHQDEATVPLPKSGFEGYDMT